MLETADLSGEDRVCFVMVAAFEAFRRDDVEQQQSLDVLPTDGDQSPP